MQKHIQFFRVNKLKCEDGFSFIRFHYYNCTNLYAIKLYIRVKHFAKIFVSSLTAYSLYTASRINWTEYVLKAK